MEKDKEYLAFVIMAILKELRRQGHDEILYKYAEDRLDLSKMDLDENIPKPQRDWIPSRLAGDTSMDLALGLYAAHTSISLLKKYVSCDANITDEQVNIKVTEIADVVDKYFGYRVVDLRITLVDKDPAQIKIRW